MKLIAQKHVTHNDNEQQAMDECSVYATIKLETTTWGGKELSYFMEITLKEPEQHFNVNDTTNGTLSSKRRECCIMFVVYNFIVRRSILHNVQQRCARCAEVTPE